MSFDIGSAGDENGQDYGRARRKLTSEAALDEAREKKRVPAKGGGNMAGTLQKTDWTR